MFYTAHPTAKGLALDAKIRAGFTTYKVTRIDVYKRQQYLYQKKKKRRRRYIWVPASKE